MKENSPLYQSVEELLKALPKEATLLFYNRLLKLNYEERKTGNAKSDRERY